MMKNSETYLKRFEKERESVIILLGRMNVK